MADLKALVTAPPYDSMSDQEVANTLRLRDQPGEVALGELNQEIDNMSDAGGVPVWEHIVNGAAVTSGTQNEIAFGIACRAALRLLRDARPDYPGVNTRAPTFIANIDWLVAGSALTAVQGDALKGKSDNRRSRGEAAGVGNPNWLDVQRARAF